MNCTECGFWNPPDQRLCSRCAADLPAPIPQGEAADDPTAAPTVIQSKRPKVKSEVLELFDPTKQRDRKAPAGTRLIRRRKRDDEGEERPAAVAGDSGGDDDAPPLPDEPKRRKRTSRRLTICTVCTAPFPARELLKLRNKLFCLPCLERREQLFDSDEVEEAKRVRTSRIAEAREREREEAEANPVRRRGTDTKRLAIQRQRAAESLSGQGSSASHTAIISPKCPRHPEHSTNDRCSRCRAPVCALCISRQGSRTMCPGCVGDTPGKTSGPRPATAPGAGLDTLKDVLLSPAIFFRNLPATGGGVRPFLFGFIGSFFGSAVILIQSAIWYSATDQLGPLTLVMQRPGPMLAGAACIALASVVIAVAVHAIAGAALGGKAGFGHSARGSMLSAGPGWLGAFPVAGAALWPLFHLTASTVMLRHVQQLNWLFAAIVALLGLAAQLAAGAAITHFVLT